MPAHETYLADIDVQRFCAWLPKRLHNLDIHLRIKKSQQCPGGLDVHCDTIEDVHANYCWRAEFMLDDTEYQSENAHQTKQALTLLRNTMREAMETNDANRLRDAMLAVLQWGGVDKPTKGATPHILAWHREGELIQAARQLAALPTDCRQAVPLHVDRYDSGLTKIASLLADNNLFVIYDSRVAATIAMLVCEWAQAENGGNVPDRLKFRGGVPMGAQVRNPSAIFGDHFRLPLLSRSDNGARRWVESQARLSWIFETVLQAEPGLFAYIPELTSRAHAMEAAFFMLGYDLRNWVGNEGAGLRLPVM